MNHNEPILADLQHIIDQSPDDVWALAHRGKLYLQMEDYRQALADFNRAIQLRRNYAWAFAHRGEVHYQLAHYQAALADFDEALHLQPDYAWASAHRGVTYYQLQHYAMALADLKQALSLNPTYGWALIHRIRTYIALQCYENALNDFDQLRTLNENQIDYWRGERGLILNYLRRFADAILCCEPALQTAPNDYIALYTLAVAQSFAHSVDAARPTIALARRAAWVFIHTKQRPGALYRLGGLAALEGQTEQALHYLQAAIPLDEEPRALACHDPAWLKLHTEVEFQKLVNQQ